jgi:hypothetical protein
MIEKLLTKFHLKASQPTATQINGLLPNGRIVKKTAVQSKVPLPKSEPDSELSLAVEMIQARDLAMRKAAEAGEAEQKYNLAKQKYFQACRPE